MNDLQKSLLEAMQIISDTTEKNSKRTVTIEGTIINNSQAGSGIYEVDYLGNKMTVYSGNLTSSYTIGEVVNILVPEGDFNKDKTILGSVRTGSNLINTDAVSGSTSYVSAGSNLLSYILTEDTYEVSTWKKEPDREYSYFHKIIELDESFANKFKNYRSTNLNDFKLSANVKAPIKTIATGTNHINSKYRDYGITIYLPKEPTESEPNPEPLVIDLSLKSGLGGLEPENIITYTKFSGTTPVDTSIVLSKTDYGYIDFWAEGYVVDEEPSPLIYDISFKDIILEPVAKVNNDTYTLTIGGDLEINEGEDFVLPTAKLMYQGMEVKAEKYYWFLYNIKGNNENIPQDIRSFVNNDYDYIEDNGQLEDYFVVNPNHTSRDSFNTIRIPADRFILSCGIKCVAIYGNSAYTAENIITNEILMKNCDFSLRTETGMAAFPAKGNINILAEFSDNRTDDTSLLKYGVDGIQYIFAYYSNQGLISVYDTIEGGQGTLFTPEYINRQINNTLVSNISIKAEDIDNGYCLIKCSAFYMINDQPKLIKTASVPIYINEELTYNVIAEKANVIYKYDIDGDSPTSGSAYNSNQPTNVIEPINIRVYNKNGSEISENQYNNLEVKFRVSKNNMYNRLYVIEETGERELSGGDYLELTTKGQAARKLYYTIKNKYSAANNENMIDITVTYDNNVFKLTAPIMFLKEGEDGINASKYVSYICVDEGSGTNEDYSYEQKDIDGNLHKLNIYKYGNEYYYTYHNNDTLKPLNDVKFQFNLYKDGEIQSGGNNIITWYEFFRKDIGTQTGQSITLNPSNIKTILDNSKILCAEITIDKMTITSYYSIDLVTIEGTGIEDITTEIPKAISYDYGFNNVLYNADGGSPSYNSSQEPSINMGYGNDYTMFKDVFRKNNAVGYFSGPDLEIPDLNKKMYYTPTDKISKTAFVSSTTIGLYYGDKDALNVLFTNFENEYDKHGKQTFIEYYNSISPEFDFSKFLDYWEQYYKDAITLYTEYKVNKMNLRDYLNTHLDLFSLSPQDKLTTEFITNVALFKNAELCPPTYTDGYFLGQILGSKFKLDTIEKTIIEDMFKEDLVNNYKSSTENTTSEYTKLKNYLELKNRLLATPITHLLFDKAVVFAYNQYDLGGITKYNGNQQINGMSNISAGVGDVNTGIYLGTRNGNSTLAAYKNGKNMYTLNGETGNTYIGGQLKVAGDIGLTVDKDTVSFGDFAIGEVENYGQILGAIGEADTPTGKIHNFLKTCLLKNDDESIYSNNADATLGPEYVNYNSETWNDRDLTVFYLDDTRVWLYKGNDYVDYKTYDELFETEIGELDNSPTGIASDPKENYSYLWAGYNGSAAALSVYSNKINFMYGKAHIDNNGNFISGNCELSQSSDTSFGNNPVLRRGWVQTNKGVAALDNTNKYLVLP